MGPLREKDIKRVHELVCTKTGEDESGEFARNMTRQVKGFLDTRWSGCRSGFSHVHCARRNRGAYAKRVVQLWYGSTLLHCDPPEQFWDSRCSCWGCRLHSTDNYQYQKVSLRLRGKWGFSCTGESRFFWQDRMLVLPGAWQCPNFREPPYPSLTTPTRPFSLLEGKNDRSSWEQLFGDAISRSNIVAKFSGEVKCSRS